MGFYYLNRCISLRAIVVVNEMGKSCIMHEMKPRSARSDSLNPNADPHYVVMIPGRLLILPKLKFFICLMSTE